MSKLTDHVSSNFKAPLFTVAARNFRVWCMCVRVVV